MNIGMYHLLDQVDPRHSFCGVDVALLRWTVGTALVDGCSSWHQVPRKLKDDVSVLAMAYVAQVFQLLLNSALRELHQRWHSAHAMHLRLAALNSVCSAVDCQPQIHSQYVSLPPNQIVVATDMRVCGRCISMTRMMQQA
jgi:hypothetical protein